MSPLALNDTESSAIGWAGANHAVCPVALSCTENEPASESPLME